MRQNHGVITAMGPFNTFPVPCENHSSSVDFAQASVNGSKLASLSRSGNSRKEATELITA